MRCSFIIIQKNLTAAEGIGSKIKVGSKNKLATRPNSFPNRTIDRELNSMVSSIELLTYANKNIKSNII